MKVVSKSRFKLGLECPNKLFFSGKPEYVNSKNEDPFLQALANGGYQVEELAKLHYPGGETLNSATNDYVGLAEETKELLERDNVIIYEAAFLVNGLFARTDILVKTGNSIKLIEVKAKSYFEGITQFTSSRDPMALDYELAPYIVDLTFQWHVVSMSLPGLTVDAFFMMVDKQSIVKQNGVNQLFRIKRDDGRIIRETKVASLNEAGGTVLREIRMTELLDQVRNGLIQCSEGKYFLSEIEQLKSIYLEDHFAGSSMAYSKCKQCEFRKKNSEDPGRSGLEECYTHQFGRPAEEVYEPNVLDVWHFSKNGDKLIGSNKFLLKEIEKSDFKVITDNRPGLSRTQRQWEQITRALNPSDPKPFFSHRELEREIEIEEWKFPYHFIDFETIAPAIPLFEGMKPYEIVAFQFSHHIMHEDGRIEHAGEFICDELGVFPNFIFATFLMEELSNDEGTIFRYSSHENTVLNQIIEQLRQSDFDTKQELIDFLLSITEVKEKSKIIRQGERSMVDLCHLVQRFYYHPFMKGSNSLKHVLPAILNSSEYIRTKYAKAIGDIGLTSRNFPIEHRWIENTNDTTIDPYKTLPAVYSEKSTDELDDYFGNLNEIANGGAAMIAYSLIQYTDMSAEQRMNLVHALLKYCELDTLAMVIVMDYLRDEVKTRSLFYGPKPDQPTAHIIYYPRLPSELDSYSTYGGDLEKWKPTRKKRDRYKFLHNRLIKILNHEAPHIAWLDFIQYATVRPKIKMSDYFDSIRERIFESMHEGFRQRQDLKRYRVITFINRKDVTLEESILEELIIDFRLYREGRALHPSERLVLLLDLLNSEIADKDYILTENNGLIINTARLKLGQMIEIIKRECT